MVGERIGSSGAGALADTVVVSNRGPFAFELEGGHLVQTSAGGGLAGSLRPLLAGSGAIWVASALGAADKAAFRDGLMTGDGLRVELVEPEPDLYDMAYNVVSNSTLWYCHHHLFDAARRPRIDRRWMEAWDAYRECNRLFAAKVAEVAPPDGRVIVHDYHLALVGTELASLRPDLHTAHFTHTPFADPSVLRMLPAGVTEELLAGLGSFGACGFHAGRWAAAYEANHAAFGRRPGAGDPAAQTFVSALAPDPDRLEEAAADPAVAKALARIEEQVGGEDRKVIVRVDRMELSKNLLRGFWAFEELLEAHPERRGRVVFVALAYPTRQSLPEYLGYQNEVESTVARINETWGTPGWTPIVLEVEDDYPRSLAALTRYDVLLVNPVRDGLNLVAMEGPLLNTTDGVLVLSRETGAFDLLAPDVFELNPFDITQTACALAGALDLGTDERASMAASLRTRVASRRPTDWLDDQLRAAK